MSANIAYQNKDIVSKITAEYFKEKSLSAYGLEVPRIINLHPTNLPVIEANELRLDNIFEFEDGSYGIIDYESDYNYLEQKLKYLNYIARIAERYRRENQPLQKLRMIVIYTGNVERRSVKTTYDIGCLKLETETAFLSGLDAEKIFERLRKKILAGEELTEEDQMLFIILPLANKSQSKKTKALKEEIELAKRISDRKQSISLLSALLVFSDKIIDKNTLKDVRRWIQMTQIGRLFEEEKMNAVNAMAKEKDEQRLKELKQKDEERLKELKQKDEERLKELKQKDGELKQKDKLFALRLLTETEMSDEEIVKIVDVFSPAQIREMRKKGVILTPLDSQSAI